MNMDEKASPTLLFSLLGLSFTKRTEPETVPLRRLAT